MKNARLFKIKDGKKDAWLAWCVKLENEYKHEAIETLREEHVFHEMFIVFSIGGQDYTLGYSDSTEGETIGQPNPDRELNILHTQTKRECLDPVADSDAVVGYSLYNT